MQTKLEGQGYVSLAVFVEDVRLVVANAVQYFDKEHALHKQALKLLDSFEDELQSFEHKPHDDTNKAPAHATTPAPAPKTPKETKETRGKGGEKEAVEEEELKAGQEIGVGALVRMLFDDGIWYPGTITKFNAKTKKYTVEFDDGEVQETKIPGNTSVRERYSAN
jgi:hypothetical protein